MEIADYLRLAGRRALALVLFPLLLAAAAGAFVATRPIPWRVATTVAAPALSSGASTDYGGAEAGAHLSAELAAVLALGPVRAELTRRTSVGSAALDAQLTVNPLPDSTLVSVAFEAQSKAKARQVAVEATRLALTTVFDSRTDIARAPLDQATAELTAIDRRLADLGRGPGGPDPATLYVGRQEERSRLDNDMRLRASRSDTRGADATAARLRQVDAEAAALAPTVAEHDQLVRSRNLAKAARDDAARSFKAATAQLAAADPAKAVSVGGAKRVMPTTEAGLLVGGGLLAGGILGFGFVAAPELLGILGWRPRLSSAVGDRRRRPAHRPRLIPGAPLHLRVR